MTTYWRRGRLSMLVLAAVTAMLVPTTAQAQITRVSNSDWTQAIGFKLGYFTVTPADGRGEDDVLFQNRGSLLFEIDDFNGGYVGGEYLIALGPWLEGGAEVGYYRATVPSIYRDLQNVNGFEIAQDLKLRITPVLFTARFLPLGRRSAFQPYIGAGVGIFNWRYSETGEFVDVNNDVFPASFVADGTEVGPVILGGARFAVGDAWLIGGELRWQDAKGDTGGIAEGFLGDKIHLGGWTTNFGIHFRF